MTKIVSVRFRDKGKEYFFDPRSLPVKSGQNVIVETARGLEYAHCVTGCHQVDDSLIVPPLRPVIRVANERDENIFACNQKREAEAFAFCEERIAARGLEMRLVRVECAFEGGKITFFFTSDGRIDFRELVRDLASTFRTRIELRQIGVRDETKMLGGIGICGRPYCCAQFLHDFIPVSIKMAKTQSLSLNPTKISGACGRLMCCLKYEQDAYEDAMKSVPKIESFVQTPDGLGTVENVSVIRQRATVRLDNSPETLRHYHCSELCVLRNGKGSREGIVIPKELPKRYSLGGDESASEEERAEELSNKSNNISSISKPSLGFGQSATGMRPQGGQGNRMGAAGTGMRNNSSQKTRKNGQISPNTRPFSPSNGKTATQNRFRQNFPQRGRNQPKRNKMNWEGGDENG